MNESMTLDPPGTVAVIGAGVIGIEAALYGRFLGYDVTVFEAEQIASRWQTQRGNPVPIMPDQCLSHLALSALQAQTASESPHGSPQALPVTVDQWIDDAIVPLTQTDLLRERVLTGHKVVRIELVPVELDPDDEQSEVIPPDFCLSIESADPPRTEVFEAVINTVAKDTDLEFAFAPPAEYFFDIGQRPSDDFAEWFHQGRKQITRVFASLGGRADLDLYRPSRGTS